MTNLQIVQLIGGCFSIAACLNAAFFIGKQRGYLKGWSDGANWTRTLWMELIMKPSPPRCAHPPAENLVAITCTVCGAHKLPGGPLTYVKPYVKPN